MNNMAVFERVARGELTPEQGANEMLVADRQAAEAKRPSWAPKWVWVVTGLAVALVFLILGIDRTHA